jgi:hypothetical protein
MIVEIGAEAAQFPEKEFINGIAVAVDKYHNFLLSYDLAWVHPCTRVQPGCHLPNSPWPGIIYYFPAGDGKTANLFIQCTCTSLTTLVLVPL